MTATTPELDRAIIRRALEVVRAWDKLDDKQSEITYPPEWRPLVRSLNVLGQSLTAAGYLEGGDRG